MRFGELSGSLTQLTNGTSYLVAGSNITITSGSSGAITIASSGDLILIESKILTGSTQTMTFSNLDGNTHKFYKLIIKRGSISSTTNYEIRPNGVTTNLAGVQHYYYGTGGTFSSYTAAHNVSTFSKWPLGDGYASNSYASYECSIHASGSYRFFNFFGSYDNAGTYVGLIGGGRWSNTTDNITSLDLYSSTANGWPADTQVFLYRTRVS